MDRELFLRELKTYGEKNDIPNISHENAQYLREMLQSNNTQHILEI